MAAPPPDAIDIPPPPPPAPSTPPPGPPDPGARVVAAWTLARTMQAFAAFIGLVIVEAIVIGVFDPEIESLAARLTLQGLLVITFIGVALVGAAPSGGLAPAAALGLRKPARPFVGPMLIGYVVYIGAALVIASLISPEQEDITRELGVDEGVLGSIVAGILIVVAAPVAEEIFFRGFMFAGFRGATRFWVAATIPSLIWGAMHYTGPESWGVCLQLAIFGVILCWLYERTGSLWPPIALHAFNNALAFAFLTSS
jgi:uncharacterized protein